MLGIPLGLLYSNAGEWLIHKYVLHGLGKKKGSFFSFHWAEHHRAARKHDFFDPDYQRSVFGQHAQGKEALAIAALMIAHAPLLPVAPVFTATVWYSALNYFYKHRRAHLDPEWAKRHLKHHFDHHMGREQDANWCVTKPWFDYLLGTRIDYAYDAQGKPIKERVEKPLAQPDLAALGGVVENAQTKPEKSAAA
jgi:sterol desaturase/sphingolipid hydroxylase (fatty acid hydroxylase superfamily)